MTRRVACSKYLLPAASRLVLMDSDSDYELVPSLDELLAEIRSFSAQEVLDPSH